MSQIVIDRALNGYIWFSMVLDHVINGDIWFQIVLQLGIGIDGFRQGHTLV